MPNLHDIERRIKSVESTKQITHTMQMVAAAKIRHSTERVEAATPYGEAVKEMLANIARMGGTFRPAPKSLRGRVSKTGLPRARVTRCALLLTWRDECAPPPRTDARAGKWHLFLFSQHISSMLED